MAIQDETKVSQESEEQRSQRLARITAYMDNTMRRGEAIVERMLDEAIAEARAEKQNQTE